MNAVADDRRLTISARAVLELHTVDEACEALDRVRRHVSRLHPELATPAVFEHLKRDLNEVCGASILTLKGMERLLRESVEDHDAR